MKNVEDSNTRFLKVDGPLFIKDEIIYYKGYDKESGREITWCEILISNFNPTDFEKLEKNIIYLQKNHIPTLLNVISFWKDKIKKIFYVIIESCSMKSLFDQMKISVHPPKIKVIGKWAYSILQVLDFLHNLPNPIIHYKIELSSIFVKSSNGMIKILPPFFLSINNNLNYFTPPEFLFNQITYLSDIWMFGILILYCYTQIEPYNECKNQFELFKKFEKFEPPLSLNLIEDNYLNDFLKHCLTKPFERSNANNLLSHPFFKRISESTSISNFNEEILFIKNPSTRSISEIINKPILLNRNEICSISTPYFCLK